MRSYVAMALVLGIGCSGSAARAPTAQQSSGGQDVMPRAETEPLARAETEPSVPAAAPARLVPPHGPLTEEDLHRGVMARLRDPRFPSCTLSPLPPSARRRVSPSANDDLASAVSFALPAGTISAGRASDREIAIYTSARLDPRTEVGDLGYRVRLRDGAGHEEDLALGVSALRPIVLVHNPMVPLIEEGTLQIEAELRAIDDASIDFVPADATSTVRGERELLLACRLEDLRRDQDGDGLTDLEEERLLTDAWDPDTDGDGARDGDDRSPLGAAAATTPADAVWLAAFRELVPAEARAGLLLVVRSGARLDLLAEGEGRVLFLREEELGAYQRRFGLRAPMVIAVGMQRGDQRARVEIDDAWSQAAYDASRDGSGTWTFTRRGAGR